MNYKERNRAPVFYTVYKYKQPINELFSLMRGKFACRSQTKYFLHRRDKEYIDVRAAIHISLQLSQQFAVVQSVLLYEVHTLQGVINFK